MAGSGNLDVLRIARELHKRHSPEITYGNHMAVHMAVGFLFLGAGRLVKVVSPGNILGLCMDNYLLLLSLCTMYLINCGFLYLGGHCQRLALL